MARHILGLAGDRYLAAGIAAFRAEIDDPVGGLDDFEIVNVPRCFADDLQASLDTELSEPIGAKLIEARP